MGNRKTNIGASKDNNCFRHLALIVNLLLRFSVCLSLEEEVKSSGNEETEREGSESEHGGRKDWGRCGGSYVKKHYQRTLRALY
jgi:hypothetical protein